MCKQRYSKYPTFTFTFTFTKASSAEQLQQISI